MFRKLILGVCIMFVASALHAANKEQRRLENSGTVMQEVMGIPDNIPQELLEKAECVIVFPSVLKAAFVVGGDYGRGAMVCRTGEHFNGPWGSPAMYALEGGSVGFQLGGQATDLVLLVITEGLQPSLTARSNLARTLPRRRGQKAAEPRQTPMPPCGRRFLAILAPVDCLREFLWRVPHFAPTMMPTRTSMAARSRPGKS
jgi:hypothetical protein